MTEFRIEAEFAEAEIWVATSPDVPGLVVQGRSPDDIVEKVRLVLPALIEIGVEPEDRLNVTFHSEAGREERRSLPLAARMAGTLTLNERNDMEQKMGEITTYEEWNAGVLAEAALVSQRRECPHCGGHHTSRLGKEHECWDCRECF